MESFRSSNQQRAVAAPHLSHLIELVLALPAVEGNMTKDRTLQYARSGITFAKCLRILSAQCPNSSFIPRKCPFAALFQSSLQHKGDQ